MPLPFLGPKHSQAEIDKALAEPKNLELLCMIMTADVCPEHRAALPPIMHANGSARIFARRQ